LRLNASIFAFNHCLSSPACPTSVTCLLLNPRKVKYSQAAIQTQPPSPQQ
jgi:hypothetical protein